VGYTDAKNKGYNVNGVHELNDPKKNNDLDGMITQLSKYESKSSTRPTKYVMLCAVRQEKEYLSDIIKTLEFANSVSSI
jgi:predicted SPOUT superfamily RNA methylase MTH1